MVTVIALPQTLPGFTAALYRAPSRIALGNKGEELLAYALQQQGYSVRIDHQYQSGDLTVFDANGHSVRLEIKTARKAKDKRYHFTLRKHWQGRQCADHTGADFVVLICVARTGHPSIFVVPVDALNVNSCTIGDPSTYSGRFARYRQNIRELRLNYGNHG